MKLHSAGYVLLEGGQLEHIAVAERALGRALPKGTEVHHVNEVKTDNRGCNLVICPDREYHQLLHVRTRALDACGNANFRQCEYCKKWDSPQNLAEQNRGSKGRRYRHRACHSAAQAESNRKRRKANREALNASARARYALDPDRFKATRARYLARKKSLSGVRA